VYFVLSSLLFLFYCALPWRDDDDNDVIKSLDASVTCQNCVELEGMYFLTLLSRFSVYITLLFYHVYYFVLYVLCAASV